MKKSKKVMKYMHLINNYPAFYSKADGQICYATKDHPVILRTYQQIRTDQKLSKKNRLNWGYGKELNPYSHINVIK